MSFTTGIYLLETIHYTHTHTVLTLFSPFFFFYLSVILILGPFLILFVFPSSYFFC